MIESLKKVYGLRGPQSIKFVEMRNKVTYFAGMKKAGFPAFLTY